MKLKKTLATLAAGLSLIGNANADSIYRGVIAPETEWQIDARVSISENEINGNKTKSIVNNNLLKYWNGREKGLFAFASVPLRHVENGSRESTGIGDITLGVGPRASLTNSFGSYHFLPYVATTLPTGDSEIRPALGNDRFDFKVGTGFTYLTPNKKGEIGAAFEYTRPGIGSSLNISDELYGGIVIGGKINDRFRSVAGITSTVKIGDPKEGDHRISSRVAIRYVPKNAKRWHAEIWLDKDIAGKGFAKGQTATGMVRYNF